jgi:alanine racemase
MKRIGFDVKRAYKNIEQIFGFKNLDIEGIFTHFATAESDRAFARVQLNKFNELLNALKKGGMEFPLVHAANSAAILDLKESHFDMVRPGLILYGYYPSDEIKNKIDIVPVMNLKSKVTYIKRVDANTGISYGRKYFTDKRTFIGSVPVGYGDGYWRLLSNTGKVSINGRLYPITGTITMDWLMINLGEKSSVKIGDDVLLIGKENGSGMGADRIAKIVRTIPYEICTAIADRVQRIYLD